MDFPDFLRETLPPMGLAWRRYHRRGVRRKVVRRMDELRVRSYGAYRRILLGDPAEQRRFADLLTVTITRFFRNRDQLVPALESVFGGWAAEGPRPVIWCAGCASGEEPFSVVMAWERFRERRPVCRHISPIVIASDIDERCLERADRAVFSGTCLREVSPGEIERFFEPAGDAWRVRPAIRDRVRFERRNLLADPLPVETLHMVCCRNLAFTYFETEERRAFTRRIADALVDGGGLVIGSTESLPDDDADAPGLRRDPDHGVLYRRHSCSAASDPPGGVERGD